MVAHDYGMKGNQLKLRVRKALISYFLQYMRLDKEEEEKTVTQHICVVNREELKPFLFFS